MSATSCYSQPSGRVATAKYITSQTEQLGEIKEYFGDCSDIHAGRYPEVSNCRGCPHKSPALHLATNRITDIVGALRRCR